MICADLANRSKHLELKSPRVNAKVASIGVTVFPEGASPDEAARAIHHYGVVGDLGDLGDGLFIAREAFAEWTLLLRKLNIF